MEGDVAFKVQQNADIPLSCPLQPPSTRPSFSPRSLAFKLLPSGASPTIFDQMIDTLQLGMSEAEIERLAARLAANSNPGALTLERSMDFSAHWSLRRSSSCPATTYP